MKARIILILSFITITQILSAQENHSINILQADTAAWGKEVFTFPLGFAREINYNGVEEARFPKGWRDTESRDFWSYIFAWKIDYQEELTTAELEKNIEYYYNGLMDINGKRKTNPSMQDAAVLFVRNSPTEYIGKIKTFDAFTTNKPLTLYAKVTRLDCPAKDHMIVVFWLSPKELEHDVWDYLGEVKISEDACTR